MGKPYKFNSKQYDYDNDDEDYLLDEDITYAKNSTQVHNSKDTEASLALEKLEKIKREAIKGSLAHKDFLETQIKIFNDFNLEWDEFLLDTEYAKEFYRNLNNYFVNKGEKNE